MDQKQLEEILEAAKPDIVASFKRKLMEQCDWKVQETISNEIAKTVQTYFQKNIAPDIEKSLLEAKDGIVAAGVSCAQGMGNEIGAALTKHLSETLSESYKRRQFFKAILD